jgi:hypothetical protein
VETRKVKNLEEMFLDGGFESFFVSVRTSWIFVMLSIIMSMIAGVAIVFMAIFAINDRIYTYTQNRFRQG